MTDRAKDFATQQASHLTDQKNEAHNQCELPEGAMEESIEHPNPNTETIDKVITPVSIKEKERENDQLTEKVKEVESKLKQ
jgi:hypothetical protein